MTIALALILHPDDGTVLIAQRKDGVHQGNLWEFPGGKCICDESPADCAVRETWEETGLKVTVLDAWPALTYAYPDRIVTLHPFLCKASSAEAQPRESKRVVWVTPAQLFDYSFPAANAPLLERLRDNPSGFTG